MAYADTVHTPGTAATMTAATLSPGSSDPKTVRFQLITPDSPHTTARLPMRVQIYPHDATDSIVTTVKNFYGLYSSPTSSKGVSFEDEAGNTMIARYENFRDDMVVYVRVIEEPALSPSAFASRNYRSPPPAGSGTPYADGPLHDCYANHTPVSHHHVQQPGDYISRPGSQASRKHSFSPSSARGRRSDSASTHSKNRSRSSKNRGAVAHDGYGVDGLNGYSSGDGAPGSSASRAKEQQPIGNTEISVENIVEGGRRKRAKFESSELPLFAPPQMPAATSNPSVSPARRADHRPSLSYVLPGQNPFAGAGLLHSPQNYNTHFGQGGVYATPGSDGRRTRTSIGYPGMGIGMGVLPTPDPTVSSVSEEDKDVAMQLMRLGEISNMSYGRTSTSTQDDTFSGRADAASSTGATSDSESYSGSDSGADDGGSEDEDDGPAKRKQRLDMHGSSRRIYQSVENGHDDGTDADFKHAALPGAGLMAAPKLKKAPANAASRAANGPKKPRAQPAKTAKAKTAKAKSTSATANGSKAKKANGAVPAVPMSPASLPASRKLSIASSGGVAAAAAAAAAIAGVADEDIADLSSKPRCQRCRKSKKGCDRQRPCGRCRDAGIPAELCISEDEGNGRKGRYGRHMGVPIKKESVVAPMQPPPAPTTTAHQLPSYQLPPLQAASSQPQPPAVQPKQPQSVQQPQQFQSVQSVQQPQQPQPIPPIQPGGHLGHLSPHSPQKNMPSLLPPAPISATPIVAPAIPAMAMAAMDKNKKRKR